MHWGRWQYARPLCRPRKAEAARQESSRRHRWFRAKSRRPPRTAAPKQPAAGSTRDRRRRRLRVQYGLEWSEPVLLQGKFVGERRERRIDRFSGAGRIIRIQMVAMRPLLRVDIGG